MEKFYRLFFDALPVRSIETDEHLHLLNPQELALIKSTECWAMFGAAAIEILAYLIIFLPMYWFPELFEGTTLKLGGPFVHLDGIFHWLKDGWMLAVTLIELFVLLLLNLAAVQGIAVATGFIGRSDAPTDTSGLIRIGLESKFLELGQFGLDPFERMEPWVLYLYLALNRLKGLIGSILLRAALVNIFGREILRVYLDFSGMPIYIIVNILTTRSILRNARVVIMGETSIELICKKLPKLELTEWESNLIYDTLQFIAVSKRDFHANHYFLSKSVLQHFAIQVKPSHPLSPDFFDKLKQAGQPLQSICKLFIVLGFLLDGSLSSREKRRLIELENAGILNLQFSQLQELLENFVNGQGLDAVTEHFLSKEEAKIQA